MSSTNSTVTKSHQNNLMTWLGWRIPAAMAWYFLLGFVLDSIAQGSILPLYSWGALGLIALPAMVIFYLSIPNTWMAVLYPCYFLMFPAAVVTIAARQSYRVAAVVRTVCSLRGSIVIGLTLILMWAFLAFARSSDFTPHLVIVSIGLQTLLLICAISWASDPLRVLIGAMHLVEKIVTSQVLSPQLSRDNATEFRTKVDNHSKTVTYAATGVAIVRRFINRPALRLVVTAFSVAAIALFAFLALGHGINILAMQRSPNPGFVGLEPSPAECVMFSTTLLLTAPLPHVVPAGPFGEFLYTSGLVATFLLLTVFLQMFSMAVGMQIGGHQTSVVECCNRIEQWMERETDVLRTLTELHKSVLSTHPRGDIPIDVRPNGATPPEYPASTGTLVDTDKSLLSSIGPPRQ